VVTTPVAPRALEVAASGREVPQSLSFRSCISKLIPASAGGFLECQKLAGEYSILIRHVAALRRRAIDLRHAVAGETTTKRVTGRVHQIARELEAEAVQLERVARTKP
jgi:hypothetical protein